MTRAQQIDLDLIWAGALLCGLGIALGVAAVVRNATRDEPIGA